MDLKSIPEIESVVVEATGDLLGAVNSVPTPLIGRRGERAKAKAEIMVEEVMASMEEEIIDILRKNKRESSAPGNKE